MRSLSTAGPHSQWPRARVVSKQLTCPYVPARRLTSRKAEAIQRSSGPSSMATATLSSCCCPGGANPNKKASGGGNAPSFGCPAQSRKRPWAHSDRRARIVASGLIVFRVASKCDDLGRRIQKVFTR